jgi:hypothetical protein
MKGGIERGRGRNRARNRERDKRRERKKDVGREKGTKSERQGAHRVCTCFIILKNRMPECRCPWGSGTASHRLIR